MIGASFIVDTGPSVGLGHLGRSTVLLAALERHGVACRLYCADPAAAAALGHRAGATPPTLSAIPRTDIIVCDSYRLSDADLRTLRARCRLLVALDDTAERPLPVDVVLNHNLYAPDLDYRRLGAGKALTGPRYALVDQRIIAAARDHADRPPEHAVVVSFGGTDDGTIAAQVANALLPRTDALLQVIVAGSRQPSATLLQLAQAQPARISVHHGPDVPALLARARLYLGSAGMMSFEAFAVGLELVVVPIAANQRPGAEALVAYGHDLVPALEPGMLAEVAARRLAQPRVIVPSPIDGQGGERAASELLDELATKPA
jgi:spore coat polysaccharide biosynthesis predicted glycosyltransferase SpsG